MKTFFSILLIILSVGYSSFGQQSDWADLEKVFGKKGTVQDGVFKITFPRSDLKVKVGDFAVDPGLALTSWIGFINRTNDDMMMNGKTMMMGDLVLLDKEVAPVISKIVSLNLEVSALHNHLIGETPTIKYVHFSGKGDAVKLAEAIKSVISVIRRRALYIELPEVASTLRQRVPGEGALRVEQAHPDQCDR